MSTCYRNPTCKLQTANCKLICKLQTANCKLQTVLVTGGKRRVGLAIAETLRKAGFRVIATSRADGFPDFAGPDAAEKVAAILAGEEIWGLVNNASAYDPSPDADSREMMQVNAVFPEKLARLLRPASVVNILDASCLNCELQTASRNLPGYFASKLALKEATLRMARELATETRVNAVAPGPVLAPENIHVPGGETLLGRRATPQDVADAVLFLLASPAVTGQILAVGG